MSRSIVRCRCGHRVLAKEVLRTDLYERRASEGSGREYVYVKFRCQRCKRMGEAFVAESRWDWSILEPDRNEMNDIERDQFLDADPISTEEILDFHRHLEEAESISALAQNGRANRQPRPSQDMRHEKGEKGRGEKSGAGDLEVPGGKGDAERRADEPPATRL